MPHVAINDFYPGYNPSSNWQEADGIIEDTTSMKYKPVDNVTISVVCSQAYTRNEHYLWSLNSNEGKIILSHPLEVIIYREMDSIVVDNNDFNITGIGDSREEALQDFEDFFVHDYIVYSETPEDQLDDNSKILLNKYRGIIKNIEKY